MPEPPIGAEAPLHVVATAGHVDHGKSSLIVRLTGIDPDRWAEEKRRGLTIDLGFAWCTLPSGREIGFVDVPGHERFVRNMLAGVGPVRLVLFVVAADEGWKPQSEEHLAIVDVLGADGGLVALTKRDLVDAETLDLAEIDVRDAPRRYRARDRSDRAVLGRDRRGHARARRCARRDGRRGAAPARSERPRLFVDRVFTIKGAGTVVTGTLTGGPLAIGDEVELSPTGRRARIRSLQTHKRTLAVARPVSRVAANLVGIEREELARGDVLAPPGRWRPTAELEARVRPVRGLGHPLTDRGAFKLYAGSAERDARIRLFGPAEVEPGGCVRPHPALAAARARRRRPLRASRDRAAPDRRGRRRAGRRSTLDGRAPTPRTAWRPVRARPPRNSRPSSSSSAEPFAMPTSGCSPGAHRRTTRLSSHMRAGGGSRPVPSALPPLPFDPTSSASTPSTRSRRAGISPRCAR